MADFKIAQWGSNCVGHLVRGPSSFTIECGPVLGKQCNQSCIVSRVFGFVVVNGAEAQELVLCQVRIQPGEKNSSIRINAVGMEIGSNQEHILRKSYLFAPHSIWLTEKK